jgi:hypothetical protein
MVLSGVWWMNILVIVENGGFNRILAKEVGRLAANTWANITLLGYLPQFLGDELQLLQENSMKYRQEVFSCFSAEGNPYPRICSENWQQKDQSLVMPMESGQKRFDLIIVKAEDDLNIVSFLRSKPVDLLILGDQSDFQSPVIAQAMEVAGSLLMIKGSKDPRQIVCCLDHDQIRHTSLEIINQLVTLYNAELKIVGFSNGGQRQKKIEACLQYLLNYYSRLKVTPWLELVDASIKTQFLLKESQKKLVALGCEKKKGFNNSLIGREEIVFLGEAGSSVLLLH